MHLCNSAFCASYSSPAICVSAGLRGKEVKSCIHTGLISPLGQPFIYNNTAHHLGF